MGQYDSFITIGEIDMEHPDIIDNVRMLASGTGCELQCDDGYEIVGDQPTCTAGAVSYSAICRCNADNEDCSREVISTMGTEDLTLYAPEDTDSHGTPRTEATPSGAAHPEHSADVVAPATHTSTETATVPTAGVVAGAAVGVLLLLIVAKRLCCSSKPRISPEDAAAAMEKSAKAMDVEGKVETTDNTLFN